MTPRLTTVVRLSWRERQRKLFAEPSTVVDDALDAAASGALGDGVTVDREARTININIDLDAKKGRKGKRGSATP